jgi:formylglycine-generating enzyme required for sulfatase activity
MVEMIAADCASALAPGTAVERFTVDHVVACGMADITYRVTDTLAGSPFLLREHVPAGHVVRTADGSFTARDEPAAAAVAMDLAHFLADCAREVTLRHAALVPVMRWFRANGTAYVVLPWTEGKSLAALLDTGQVPGAAQVLAMVSPLLDALEYLHARDVLQREIGPQCIRLGAAGGLLLGGECTAAPQPLMADAPAARGRDAYAAIERFGPDLPTGPWTDIYALAATLFQWVTGAPPPTAVQRKAALSAGRPDPLQTMAVTGDDSQERRDLVALITRGLALEPAARPQSVREWRARITRVPGAAGQTEPVAGHRPPADSRNWLPVAFAAVLVVVIAAMAIFLLYDRSGERGSDAAAVSQQPPAGDASAEETERWRQALEVNAVAAYRAFIEDFPQSMNREQAQQHIDQLEDQAWELVLAENTRAAYEAHLETFPHGRHAAEALAKIDEFKQQEARLAREREEKARQDDLAWDTARSAGTVAALDDYLASWPGGAHAGEARDLRQKLQFEINDTGGFELAARQNTIEAYRGYINDFPAGRHVAAARQAIDGLTLRPGKSFQDCADCPLMVVVPAGAFWQGSSDASPYALSMEKPRRRVVMDEPFAVGEFEVTMAQWDACVADKGCDTQPQDNGWGRGTRPVIMVSWNDAMQYAGWLSAKTGQSYSLPSESQWEYFARAGEESDWLGGQAAGICAYGNIAGDETGFEWRHRDCADNSALATLPVGSFQANAFGLYDVIGNVAEWTLDCMNLSYLEAPADGSAWSRGMCSSRMTRGGSWFTGTKESRLSARFNLKNGDRNDFTGFRLVRRVEKQ